MDDHHTAAQKFHKWTKSEEKKGCPVEAEWAWMIPPISASLSPNFHREFEDVFKLPALIRRARARLLSAASSLRAAVAAAPLAALRLAPARGLDELLERRP